MHALFSELDCFVSSLCKAQFGSAQFASTVAFCLRTLELMSSANDPSAVMGAVQQMSDEEHAWEALGCVSDKIKTEASSSQGCNTTQSII